MIHIREKCRPFSHRIGSQCILPGTNLVVQGSPERIFVGDVEVFLGHSPYTEGFTLSLDLERNCVWIFGKGFRIKVFATKDGFFVGDRFFEKKHGFHLPEKVERLSFGNTKVQDWDMVLRRMDLKEILPTVYHLAQKIPAQETGGERFQYHSYFEQLLVPKKEVRSVFEELRAKHFLENEESITLLPNPLFSAGRMKHIQTRFGSIDMSWVKGRLQRAILHVEREQAVRLLTPKGISFRVKDSLADRGKTVKVGEVLHLTNSTLYLDRFYQ